MPCKRCGRCCTSLHFVFERFRLDQDKKGFADFIRYHHCKVIGVRLEDGGPEVMGVRVPLTCQHLEWEKETGLALCAIYNERPQFCRDHLCENAQ